MLVAAPHYTQKRINVELYPADLVAWLQLPATALLIAPVPASHDDLVPVTPSAAAM